MAIDFTLTAAQLELQESARDFAQNVLLPVVREADEEPDPLRGFNLTRPAYREAVQRGIAFSMLPKGKYSEVLWGAVAGRGAKSFPLLTGCLRVLTQPKEGE